MDIIKAPYTGASMVLDATMLTNIMGCGRKTNFKHNLNLTPISGKGNSLEVGSIIHKFMEVYYKSQKNGIARQNAFGFGISAAELYIQGCPDCTNFEVKHELANTHDVNFNHICDERCQLKPKCGHPPNEYPGLDNTPAESEGYLIGWKYALDTCDQYHKFYLGDSWTTLDTEIVKSRILYQDDEIRILFKSKLDWIVDINSGPNSIFPCDHKTMKQNRDTLSINNQFMGQCHQLDTTKVIINKVGLQKTLKPEDKFKRVVISYSPERLLEWQSEILPYWCKQYLLWNEQGYFPPNFNSCESKFGKCEFYGVCEANPNMREEELRATFKVGAEWNPQNSDE